MILLRFQLRSFRDDIVWNTCTDPSFVTGLWELIFDPVNRIPICIDEGKIE